MAEKTANFSINLKGDADEVSAEMAAEFEKLRAKIAGSNDAVKNLGSSLRSLRGASDEVKAAKAQLRGMIESERTKVSQANVALLKQGVTYERLAGNARKAAEAQKKIQAKKEAAELAAAARGAEGLGRGFKAAGGPVQDLVGRFEGLRELLGGAGGASAALAASLGLVVAAAAAVTVAFVGAAVSLGRWILETANAARSMAIAREQVTGSAVDALHLGHQLDALAAKVATPKAELAKLGNELVRTYSGTRIGGQAIIDTWEAVARASDAMGDSVGSTLKGIMDRAKLTGRVQVSPFELQGTGLQLELPKQISAITGKSMREVQASLQTTGVSASLFAEALKRATQVRFGKGNADKLLDLNVLLEKTREKIAALAANVDLTPLLKELEGFTHLLDSSTVTGAALKTMIESLGKVLVHDLAGGVKSTKDPFRLMVLGALEVSVALLKVRNYAIQHGDAIKAAMLGVAVIFGAVATVAALLAASVLAVPAAFVALLAVPTILAKAGDGLGKELRTWLLKGTNASIDFVMGIVNGIKAGTSWITEAVKGLGDTMVATFKKVLKISSPSKVMVPLGLAVPQGVGVGIDQGAGELGNKAQAMANAATPGPPAGRSSGAGARAAKAGGQSISLTINVEASGNANGQEIKATLSDPTFLAKFLKALEDLGAQMGVPTQEDPST